MTQGINEANKLYSEKMMDFNNQMISKNKKLNEYKNKISVLKIKINEMHEELNNLRGSNSVNNNSFYSTSFINNSIINANNNQNQPQNLKSFEKFMNNTFQLNHDLNINKYNSKTIDRNDIMKRSFDINKTVNNIGRKIYFNNEIKSPNLNKDNIFPQTPQIKKYLFVNKNDNINKNKVNEKERKDLLKEYNDILTKFTNSLILNNDNENN